MLSVESRTAKQYQQHRAKSHSHASFYKEAAVKKYLKKKEKKRNDKVHKPQVISLQTTIRRCKCVSGNIPASRNDLSRSYYMKKLFLALICLCYLNTRSQNHAVALCVHIAGLLLFCVQILSGGHDFGHSHLVPI